VGIDDEIEIVEPLDEHVLRLPKQVLAGIYAVLAIWSAVRIYFFEMYQEEFIIRLIFIGLIVFLSTFIVFGQKWAMTTAYTVLLCYFGAFYLLLELRLSVGLVGLVVFLGVLTLRAMTATDQAYNLQQRSDAQIFE
jgi:hypothetical protein